MDFLIPDDLRIPEFLRRRETPPVAELQQIEHVPAACNECENLQRKLEGK